MRTDARWKDALWFAPAAVLLLLAFGYPVIRTLILSVLHLNLETGLLPRFAAFENFIRLAADSRFVNSLRVTAVIAAVSVALECLIGLLLALAAERMNRGRPAARAVLLIPWALPTAMIAVLWMWLFNDQYGIINAVLMRAGLMDAPFPWLAMPGPATFAIIAADVWKTFPFVMIVLLAGLQSIPREMYEAIEIDGGNAWHRFRYVTFPFLRPFLFLALVFRLIQAFAIFDLVYVMTGGGPGGATETVSVYSYTTFMRYLDFGYGAAQVVILVIILSVLAWALHRLLLKRYEMAG